MSSYEAFREAFEKQNLSPLLGMNLLSFEKYLRDKHDIVVCGKQDGERSVRVGGRVVHTFRDDNVSSITGQLVCRLRTLCPEADSLVSAPLVQVVSGRSIDDVLGDFDFSKFEDDFFPALDACGNQELQHAAQQLRTAVAAGDELIDKYNQVEALHKLLVKVRQTDFKVEGSGHLPYNTKEEYDLAVDGEIERSLRWYKKLGHIPQRVIDEYETFFPNRCHVSEDLKEIRVTISECTLIEALGLPETPSWLNTVTLEGLQLEAQQQRVPRPHAPQVVSEDEDEPVPSTSRASGNASGGTSVPRNVGGQEVVGAQAGVDHVVDWIDVDVTKLSPAEKEECWFGFPGAKVYFKGVSPAALKRVVRNVKAGKHRDVEVIYTIATGLKRVINKRDKGKKLNPPTPDQLGKMAGGLVVKRKSIFVIIDDGYWERLGGEEDDSDVD